MYLGASKHLRNILCKPNRYPVAGLGGFHLESCIVLVIYIGVFRGLWRICLADSLVRFHLKGRTALFIHWVLCSRRSNLCGFLAVGFVGNRHLRGHLVGSY
jgi:hypothetical protein